jgi:hypothetical protein
MRPDPGDKDRLKALVEGRDWAPLGTTAAQEGAEGVEEDSSEDDETPRMQGFRSTRPAGFEPATSRSGGERSIH